MSDSIRTGDATGHDPREEAHNPRRDFLKVMVTAVAGLTVAGNSDASTPASEGKLSSDATVTIATQQKLAQTLDAYAAALSTRSSSALKPYFSAKIDFRSTGAIVRTWSDLEAELAADPLLYLRADAFITHVKWLAPNLALVDGNFASGSGRAWFTEVWRGFDSFTVDVTRLRSGGAEAGYQALTALPTGVVPGDIDPSIAVQEEGALRNNFRTFRAAFNAGDVGGVTALTSGTVDAIPVFSFLDGRAQILNGQAAVGDKAARMLGEQAIQTATKTTTGAIRTSALAQRATYVAGEPKLIRFLPPSLAVVDGTADINDIPAAHEFSPSSMRGVYSTVWTKVSGQWKAEAARPWF